MKILKCKVCGSTEVNCTALVYPNTGAYLLDQDPTFYCDNCKKEVETIIIESNENTKN